MKEGEIGFFLEKKDDSIVFRRESERGKRELTFRNPRCVSCWMCHEACPVEAIEINPSGSTSRELISEPKIVVDPEKCVLCGICANICLFNALEFSVNGTPLQELPGYPKYERKWEWSPGTCKMKDEEKGILCDICEQECPREALQCSIEEIDGKPRNWVVREEKLCVYCTRCQRECPVDAITTEKVFEGDVSVDQETCQGCGVCVDVCPTACLSMPKSPVGIRVEKVVADRETCIYCGACAKACPVKAIEVVREGVHLTEEEGISTTKMREKVFTDLITQEAPKA
jgi:4Fe-4S ferredoxin